MSSLSAPVSITHKYDNADVEYVRKDSIAAAVEKIEGAWTIGKCYLIRTVTMTQVGRLIYVDEKELVMSNASWVADTGRFHTALSKGELNEVEPFVSNVIIGRGAIVDATEWIKNLPTVQK